MRTVYLAGLDPRVKCAICVGFMTVAREVLEEKIVEHTWMFHVPHLSRFMDLPDVISLHGPGPLMVQYNREDQLWTREGQEQADAKLTAIYSKLRRLTATRGSSIRVPTSSMCTCRMTHSPGSTGGSHRRNTQAAITRGGGVRRES